LFLQKSTCHSLFAEVWLFNKDIYIPRWRASLPKMLDTCWRAPTRIVFFYYDDMNMPFLFGHSWLFFSPPADFYSVLLTLPADFRQKRALAGYFNN
jgi:hypothetical protein